MHEAPDSTAPPATEAATQAATAAPAAGTADGTTLPPGLPALRHGCDRARLPEALRGCFHPLSLDADGRRRLAELHARRPGALRTAAFRGLRRAMSDFDAYGLLGMYGSHLLSEAQLGALLGLSRQRPAGALLDVGAGNGDAMAPAAALFGSWHATESSAVMRRRLRARGARVHDVDLGRAPLPAALSPAGGYDVVACLNVIDRTLYPATLLAHARAALRPGGKLLLSVPLPLRPHVDVGGHTVDQEQPLPRCPEDSWEAGAGCVAARVLSRAGLRVTGLSRVPYVCQGDARTAWHVLDAALFVCEAVV